MSTKEELKNLIDKIKAATGKTQQAIGEEAGYKERSLTQALSKKTGHEAVIKRLKIAWSHKLENPTYPVVDEAKERPEVVSGLKELLISKEETIAVLRESVNLLKKENERLSGENQTNLDDLVKRAREIRSTLKTIELLLPDDADRGKLQLYLVPKDQKTGKISSAGK